MNVKRWIDAGALWFWQDDVISERTAKHQRHRCRSIIYVCLLVLNQSSEKPASRKTRPDWSLCPDRAIEIDRAAVSHEASRLIVRVHTSNDASLMISISWLTQVWLVLLKHEREYESVNLRNIIYAYICMYIFFTFWVYILHTGNNNNNNNNNKIIYIYISVCKI